MKTASLLSASLIPSWALVRAQVVQWEIEKRQINPGLDRRAATTFEEVITNNRGKGGYFSSVSIGTPPQNLTIQLDTGSSDVWVPYHNAEVCTDKSIAGGCTLGSFNPNASSTFDDVGQGLFQISYVDNSYAKGDYFTDNFEIGGAEVKNLTMGLGIKATIPYGLLGVGYASNEASTETADVVYPNLPVALYQNGDINTIAYSLWLNDLDASTGSILFGGIDTEKFVGNLTRIDIVGDGNGGGKTHFAVELTSIIASSSTGSDTLTSDSYPITAVLDSGTTLSYVPQDVAEKMWKEVGAYYEPEAGLAILPCSFADHNGHFSFQLAGPDGPRINITMDELVVDLTDGNEPTFNSGAFKGQTACEFGFQNYTDTPYLLGDTFLRSAYVVYDLVNNEIGIAQTDFNSTKSNVVAFKSHGARVPDSTAAATDDTATTTTAGSQATQTSYAAASGFQASTDNSSSNESMAYLSVAPGSSFAMVGITMVMLLLMGSGAC